MMIFISRKFSMDSFIHLDQISVCLFTHLKATREIFLFYISFQLEEEKEKKINI